MTRIEGWAAKLFWAISCLKIAVAIYIPLSYEPIRKYFTYWFIFIWEEVYKMVLLEEMKLASEIVREYVEETFEGLRDPQSQSDFIKNKKLIQEYEAKAEEKEQSMINYYEEVQEYFESGEELQNNPLYLLNMPSMFVLFSAPILLPLFYFFKKTTVSLTASAAALVLLYSMLFDDIIAFISEYLITNVIVFTGQGIISFWFDGDILINPFNYSLAKDYYNPIPKTALAMINVAYILCIAVLFVEDVKRNSKGLKIILSNMHLILRPKQLQRKLSNTWLCQKPKQKTKFDEFASICISGEVKGQLKKLLEDNDFNVNQRQVDSGNTGLHLACLHQNMNVIQALMENKRAKKININIENSEGKTPLMLAASTGNKNVVRHLLKQPKLKLKDHHGDGAIAEAVEKEHYSVALLIAEEITRRGLCLRDCCKFLNGTTLLESLRHLDNKSRKSGVNQDKPLHEYNANILKCLLEVPGEGQAKEKVSQEMIMEELKEYLECNICYEEFDGTPLLACENDHWLCSKCYQRNETCPTCRVDLNRRVPRRCRTSEKILKLISALELPK